VGVVVVKFSVLYGMMCFLSMTTSSDGSSAIGLATGALGTSAHSLSSAALASSGGPSRVGTRLSRVHRGRGAA